MALSLEKLDVREKKGTYLVFTASGGAYTVTASKNPAGQVTVSGGSCELPEVVVLLDDNVITINQVMRFTSHQRRMPTTSAVRTIYRAEDLSEEQVRTIAESYRKQRDYDLLVEAPPVFRR